MKGSERLFYIVSLLKSNKKLKAIDIATICAVTERQIYRDLNMLSSMGVPLYFEKDGYKLLSEAFLPSLNFSLDEILAVKLGLAQPALESIENLKKAINTAQAKIESVLNPELSQKLKSLDKKIVISSKDYKTEELNTKIFSRLEEAAAKFFVIEIKYHALSTNKITKRVVEPYGIVYIKNFWYLVGWCRSRREYRTFRINRIKEIKNLNQNFAVPENFTIEEYFSDSWGIYRGKKIKVKVSFSPKISRLLKETKYHPSQKVKLLKDNSAVLEVTVAGLDEITGWLLSFGENVKVLEPDELKDKMRNLASTIIKFYSH